MKKTLILILIAVSSLGFVSTEEVDVQEIASVIQGISPHVTEKSARKYAKIIDKYADEYDVDWKVAVAIIKQESDFVPGEINDNYQDFGIGQLNYRNIKKRHIDLVKLLSDQDYAIRQTFMILADIKKAGYNKKAHSYGQYFTKYHSYTLERRKIYWFGERASGSDGLKYKLALINRILNNGRDERSGKTKIDSSRGLGGGKITGSSKRKLDLSRTSSTSGALATDQKRLPVQVRVCRLRKDVLGKPTHDSCSGDEGKLEVGQGRTLQDPTVRTERRLEGTSTEGRRRTDSNDLPAK